MKSTLQTVSIKMEESLLKEIDSSLKKNRYATRTEFIRDAIRVKLTQAEKEEMMKHIDSLRGISKRKTTDEELHEAGEKAFDQLEREFGIK